MSDNRSLAPTAVSDLSAGEVRRAVWNRWSFRSVVLVGWAVFVGVWYFASRFLLNTQLLPEPHIILGEVWSLVSGSGRSDVVSSLSRVVYGFLLAVLVSTGLGLLTAFHNWWRIFIRRVLLIVGSLPTVSLAVLVPIVFGVSTSGPILVTSLVALPYITMNIAQGLSGVDRSLIVMSESFGRTRSQIVRSVLLPSSVLSVLGGARVAFAAAWRMELLAEVFAASSGVGFQIRRSFEGYDIRGLIAWTVLYIAVMLVIENLVFRQIERRVFSGIYSEMA